VCVCVCAEEEGVNEINIITFKLAFCLIYFVSPHFEYYFSVSPFYCNHSRWHI